MQTPDAFLYNNGRNASSTGQVLKNGIGKSMDLLRKEMCLLIPNSTTELKESQNFRISQAGTETQRLWSSLKTEYGFWDPYPRNVTLRKWKSKQSLVCIFFSSV